VCVQGRRISQLSLSRLVSTRSSFHPSLLSFLPCRRPSSSSSSFAIQPLPPKPDPAERRDIGTHKATIVGNEGGDLLSVLDELNPDTLPDSGVGLLGLNTDLLKNDTLGVGRSSSGRGLVDVTKSSLLVGLVGLWESKGRGGRAR